MRTTRPNRRGFNLRPIGVAACVLGIALTFGNAAQANDIRVDMRIIVADNDDWRDLNDAERRALSTHRNQWQRYSPEQRHRLRGGAQRFMTLSPEERHEVIRGRERYQNLPPAQREHLREEYRREHGRGNKHRRDRDDDDDDD